MNIIRSVRDTFLHFLDQALGDDVVWSIYTSFDAVSGTADAAHSNLKKDAVNVQFIADNPRRQVSSVVANIDLVYDDELEAVDVLARVITVLQAAGMVPVFDFSSDSPTPVGTQLYWNADNLNFKPVTDKLAYRRTCSLTLNYRTLPVPGIVTSVP